MATRSIELEAVLIGGVETAQLTNRGGVVEITMNVAAPNELGITDIRSGALAALLPISADRSEFVRLWSLILGNLQAQPPAYTE